MGSNVPRPLAAVAYRGGREGQRGRFAPGGTLGGAAKKGEKEKMEKGRKERRGKEKTERKENMGEACNNSETKMEHLSCGAPMQVKT